MNRKQLNRAIFEVGVPSFLETLFTTFASIIDSKMVSALGVTAISAVSVTNQPRLFIFTVFFALNTVTSSLVAKYVGRGDRDMANRTFATVIKIIIPLAAVLSVLAVLLARPIMIAFANQKDTLNDSVTYFRIVMGGMIFNLLFMAINAALRGCGKTRITFVTNVTFCVVNIFFNYLLIEGHLGFPRMEYAGAALATVLGTVAAFILSVTFACRQELFVNIPYCLKKHFNVGGESLKEITRMAKSCVTDNLVMRLSLLLIGAVVARIGSHQMAVYSIGMHLLNVNMAVGTGLQTAGVALIGRSYGAGDRDAMQAYRKQIYKIGVISAVVLGAVIMAGGKTFYSFFDTDAEFVRLGTMSCFIIGVISLSQTVKFVWSGCLQGIGAMREVMIASIVSFAGLNLTTLSVLVLVFHIGVWGVWISSLIAQTAQALILYHYVRKSNAFKTNEVTL